MEPKWGLQSDSRNVQPGGGPSSRQVRPQGESHVHQNEAVTTVPPYLVTGMEEPAGSKALM